MANAPVLPSGAETIDIITITAPMLSNGGATLSGTPVVPTKTLVSAGGVVQTYGSDFTISGNTIGWNSMGLGSILSVGNILNVQYFTL